MIYKENSKNIRKFQQIIDLSLVLHVTGKPEKLPLEKWGADQDWCV